MSREYSSIYDIGLFSYNPANIGKETVEKWSIHWPYYQFELSTI